MISVEVLSRLGDISIDTFLNEYWQQKPLLIRNAIPDAASIIEADELAGLSLEDDLESRLVIQKDQDWEVEHGPFADDRFANIQTSHWSLLVQNVDSAHPGVNELLRRFRFLPNWRIDDIMVSFAADRGSVGAHFDYYDVFLLQGEGQRNWKIGQRCDSNSPLVDNVPMKLLQSFDCKEEWITKPGDLLYIPAQVAHWGESIGESICYSIGFRAPSHSEFLSDYSLQLCDDLNLDHRYRDGSEVANVAQTGEIQPEVVENLRATLLRLADNPIEIGHWLAQFSTELKPGIEPDLLPLDFAEKTDFTEDTPLALSHFNRCAFYRLGKNDKDDTSRCYINGKGYEVSTEFAQTLSNYAPFTRSSLSNSDQNVALSLVLENKIVLSTTDERHHDS